MFKQQSPSGEQTCFVHDNLTGVKANLQGQHILPPFNSLKAGMGLSETFCAGHGISQKKQSHHLWAQTFFPQYVCSPVVFSNCALEIPTSMPIESVVIQTRV